MTYSSKTFRHFLDMISVKKVNAPFERAIDYRNGEPMRRTDGGSGLCLYEGQA
jgi:hypothetical protein